MTYDECDMMGGKCGKVKADGMYLCCRGMCS